MSLDAKIQEGFLVIDKDQGPTSHDVVAEMRRILGMRRIGHCGTLDPLATGVLVLCFGSYTRLSEWISAEEKEYESTFCLGATSDTGDAQGEIAPTDGKVAPTRDAVDAALDRFRGAIEQVPHAFSAIKVQGVRSYDLARRKQPVELKARPVFVSELEVLGYEYPDLVVRVVCSKGTYIRSLAQDLGALLGTGAYVKTLRRMRVGHLDLSSSFKLAEVRDSMATGGLEGCLVPPAQALCDLPRVMLEPRQLAVFGHGGLVPVEKSAASAARRARLAEGEIECAILDAKERLYGVARWVDGGNTLKPLKVLRQTELSEPAGVCVT